MLYTNEVPPVPIKQNTLGNIDSFTTYFMIICCYKILSIKGNQIMKGFLEKELVNGKVSYEKIQIKEVTSHYLNGCISMIIFPNPPKVEFKGQIANNNNSTIIDFS